MMILLLIMMIFVCDNLVNTRTLQPNRSHDIDECIKVEISK
jgi:hypothetical protein